jgi:hypothetical protein
MSEKTVGEHLVRTTFNPSNDGLIDQIKQKSADLINLISQIEDGINVDYQAARLKSLAITNIENGAMWAVKAATCEKYEK